MAIRFDGQVALVTGGGRGMGREHCLLLASQGASVVVNDLGVAIDGTSRTEDPAQEVVDQITKMGGSAVASHHDCSAMDGPEAMVRLAIERFGRIDIVVHNAAIATFGPFGELTYSMYRDMMAVHLDAAFMLAQAAWPHMVKQQHGRFVFITSQVALSGVPNMAHYVVAKTGVTGLARALAMEGEPLGIRANALGVTALTRLMEGFFKTSEEDGERPVLNHMNSSTEDWWKKHMRPELVSPVVAWLASPECDVNGQILDTAGGFTVHQYINTTRGYYDPELTPEAVHHNRARIFERKDAQSFARSTDLSAWRNTLISRAAR